MTDLVCPPVLQKGLYPLARQLCKTGCLVAHRRTLWCAAMGVDPDLPQVCGWGRRGGGRGCGEEGSSICMHVLYHSNGSVSFHFVISPVHTLIQHAFHFEELKSSVLKHSLLFERLMVKVGDTW